MELKQKLGIEESAYKNFFDFKKRVLNPLKEELSRTDLSFTYDMLKAGRGVEKIRFFIQHLPTVKERQPGEWEKELLEMGVSTESVAEIYSFVEQKVYDEEYIKYAIKEVKTKERTKEVKSPGGLVYQVITNRYYKKEYQRDLRNKERAALEVYRKEHEPHTEQKSILEIEEIHAYNKKKGKAKFDTVEELIEDMKKDGYKHINKHKPKHMQYLSKTTYGQK